MRKILNVPEAVDSLTRALLDSDMVDYTDEELDVIMSQLRAIKIKTIRAQLDSTKIKLEVLIEAEERATV